jgi:GH24 family phage-related lysozyme (muramidase)
MNNHHRLNAHGLRLLVTFEKGPADGSVRLSSGGAALTPYVCPGGELTIGYGCTKWFGGRDVATDDRLSGETEALSLLQEQVIEYEDAIRQFVTVPLNSNQFSALVCFAFNCGVKAFAGSTLLKHVNASRFDDAADAFGMWLYSTSGAHKQALRGLLRRRYSEAVLWMGYDFEVACADDAVALVRERPPNNIGTDKVLSKTPFKDVLSVAQRYPLTDELVLSTPAPAPSVPAGKADQPGAVPQPKSPAASAPKPAAASPAAAPAVKPGVTQASPPPVVNVPAVIPAPAPVGTKAKSPNTVAPAEVPYRIDPNAGLKPLEESDRAKGYLVQQVGISIIRLGSLGVFGSTVQAGATVVQGDPVLSNVLLIAFCAAGVAIVGYVIKAYGTWKRKRGEKAATQGLY